MFASASATVSAFDSVLLIEFAFVFGSTSAFVFGFDWRSGTELMTEFVWPSVWQSVFGSRSAFG